MSSLISLILYILLDALFAGVLYFVVYKAVKRAVIEANEELHTTILLVTHDAYAASFANRILIFKDGSIIRELLKQDADRRTFYETIAQEVAKLDTER